MRNLWKLLAVVVLTAGFAYLPGQRAACACSCAAITQAQAADYADLVVVGTVTAASDPAAGLITYTVAVEKVEKGEAPGTIKLTTSGSEASCGIRFDLGKRYRLYAKDGETGLCSGNTPLSAGAGSPGPSTSASTPAGTATLTATSPDPESTSALDERGDKAPGDNVAFWLGATVLAVLSAAIAFFLYRRLRSTTPPA